MRWTHFDLGPASDIRLHSEPNFGEEAMAGTMRIDFIELARICLAHSRATASPEVAAELRRIAEGYRKQAVDLEWQDYAANGEENVGEALREGKVFPVGD
jgi:hypothetical protein